MVKISLQKEPQVSILSYPIFSYTYLLVWAFLEVSMPKRIVLRRSSIHGKGVFALIDLSANLTLLEYRGCRITHARADRLYSNTTDDGHTFLFWLNERYVIDANADGNIARWINYSCAPNCQAVLEENADGDARKDRVWIETLRPICAGEELTYDYGIITGERITPRLKRIWACHCSAPNCTGTMLHSKSRKR